MRDEDEESKREREHGQSSRVIRRDDLGEGRL